MRLSLALVGMHLSLSSSLSAAEIRAYCSSLPNQTLIIGMVTKGNAELTLQRWRPTFQNYLSNFTIAYGCHTTLVPLEFDTYEPMTASKQIDFIFPNPTAFQEMKTKYGIVEFLSVKRNFGEDQELDRFGGVIVRAADHLTDVVELGDLLRHKGISMCAVDPGAFGGWQIQWYEMIKHGVVISEYVQDFVGSHEKAIRSAVVDRTCDLGIARTETVERMIANGEFNASAVFVIGDQSEALGFPQYLTTELYPEWPLASLAHVPREIQQIVAVPLLLLNPQSPEAIIGDFAGFAFPYSYEPVRQMFLAIDKDGTGQCDAGQERVRSDPGVCQECMPGSYSKTGLGACILCPEGTVNNGTANTDCIFCPMGLTTLSPGGVAGDCVPIPVAPTTMIIAIVVTISGVLFVILTSLVLQRAVKHYRQLKRAAHEAELARLEMVRKSVDGMRNIRFPFTVMRYSKFKEYGRLVRHEVARNNGDLLMFDTWNESVAFAQTSAVAFISHQWLGAREPDPQNKHYAAMVTAGAAVCRDKSLAEDELYMWVDYHSIPQSCTESKISAITSIAVYACCARYFVAVAPNATHVDFKKACDPESYANRGWCRLEQWAFMAVCGVESMYLLQTGEGEPAEPTVIQQSKEDAGKARLLKLSDMDGWLEQAVKVYGAEFSVEEDKHALVEVILGLYGFMLIEHIMSKNDSAAQTAAGHYSSVWLAQQIESNKDNVFPPQYFKGLIELLEAGVAGALNDGSSFFSAHDFEAVVRARAQLLHIQGKSLASILTSQTTRQSRLLQKLSEMVSHSERLEVVGPEEQVDSGTHTWHGIISSNRSSMVSDAKSGSFSAPHSSSNLDRNSKWDVFRSSLRGDVRPSSTTTRSEDARHSRAASKSRLDAV